VRNPAATNREFFLNPRQRALLSAALVALVVPTLPLRERLRFQQEPKWR
jgi:hypothetical protein